MAELQTITETSPLDELFELSFRDFALADSLSRVLSEASPDEDFRFHLLPRVSSKPSASPDLDGIPEEIYCAWDPSSLPPSLQKKASKKFCLLDLVSIKSARDGDLKKTETLERGKKVKRDVVTAHRVFYVERRAVTGNTRRSFLPYRQDLLGIFSSPSGSPIRSLLATM